MARAVVLLLALVISTPAYATSCAELKAAVEKYGLDAVKAEARKRGASEEKIEAEQRRCNLK